MAGNLPPLGAACVIVEEQGRFLMVKRFDGRLSFPGGFMRWREDARQAARRECREETGLNVELSEPFGIYSNISRHPLRMSTLSVAYIGKLAGEGTLRSSVEGHPIWMTEAEMRNAIDWRY